LRIIDRVQASILDRVIFTMSVIFTVIFTIVTAA
jgi:hypothetical protein